LDGKNAERPIPDVEIAGLSADSRTVRRGFLFAALAGAKTSGDRFLGEALAKGAVAVLAATPLAVPQGVALIVDPEPRHRLALMAARFYGRQPETIAAVTGTNGKTSVVDFTAQLWRALGHPAASLGTLGVRAPGFEVVLAHTTPDPIELHRLLAELKRCDIDRVAIEASSHGLAQSRMDGVSVKAAAFTNLSRDHLDYHGTIEAYFAAKMRLFECIMPPGGTAVVNADSDWFDAVSEICAGRRHRLISYGRTGRELRLLACEVFGNGRRRGRRPGQRLSADVFGARYAIELPFLGGFQAENALCALGLVIACGEEPKAAVAALNRLKGVRGRLEPAAERANGASVFVDYAHTPDALEHALAALRQQAKRLVLVFGCGGDRDQGKRALMGEIAARLADRVFVTDDNPRGENPASIRAMVLARCPGAIEVGDRAAAIARAVEELEPGDILLLAGKGHEQGQIIGDLVYPFDDASQARTAVRAADAAERGH
jgi:UDP-N-acetylmuramoyl-L-alanyl-D-glutamate--2,6-diaminopimelate ligase